MNNTLRGACLIIALLTSCNTSDFEGFDKLDKSIHFKLVALGDDERKITENSFVTIRATVTDRWQNPIMRKKVNRVLLQNANLPEFLPTLLLSCTEGDSLEIIGTAADMDLKNWLEPQPIGADTQFYIIRMQVSEVLNSSDLMQLRAQERALNDAEINGYSDMVKALDSLNLDDDDLINGVFYRDLIQGKGKGVTSGVTAYLHYKTYLADGRLVDNTYTGGPFEYQVGKPDQVIKGFGAAVANMKVGGKAVFVIPPDLAYGAKGSSSGIVPPFACLIYEVELLNVRN